jgi:hypothetical protein
MEPKGHDRVHKSPQLVLILSKIKPIHTITCYLYILMLSTHLRLGLHSGLSLSGCPTNILYAVLFTPTVLYVLPISSSLTCSNTLQLVISEERERSICIPIEVITWLSRLYGLTIARDCCWP